MSLKSPQLDIGKQCKKIKKKIRIKSRLATKIFKENKWKEKLQNNYLLKSALRLLVPKRQ